MSNPAVLRAYLDALDTALAARDATAMRAAIDQLRAEVDALDPLGAIGVPLEHGRPDLPHFHWLDHDEVNDD
jgi:hypothetical protein